MKFPKRCCLFVLLGLWLGSAAQAQTTTAFLNVTEGFLRDRIVHSCDLAYPLVGRARLPGYVVFKLLVDEAGQVSEKEILAGHVLLDGAAKECVEQIRFDPPKIDGRFRRMSGLYTVRFDLVKDAPFMGEDLPLIQALGADRFMIAGKEMPFSALLQWLQDEQAITRYRKVRLRPDSEVDVNKLLGKLRQAGVKQVCLFYED